MKIHSILSNEETRQRTDGSHHMAIGVVGLVREAHEPLVPVQVEIVYQECQVQKGGVLKMPMQIFGYSQLIRRKSKYQIQDVISDLIGVQPSLHTMIVPFEEMSLI